MYLFFSLFCGLRMGMGDALCHSPGMLMEDVSNRFMYLRFLKQTSKILKK